MKRLGFVQTLRNRPNIMFLKHMPYGGELMKQFEMLVTPPNLCNVG